MSEEKNVTEIGVKCGNYYYKMIIDNETNKVINEWYDPDNRISLEEYKRISPWWKKHGQTQENPNL